MFRLILRMFYLIASTSTSPDRGSGWDPFGLPQPDGGGVWDPDG